MIVEIRMRKPKGKSKIREQRGQGEGAAYIPWIKTRELSSMGTKSLINDWKHGKADSYLVKK